MATCYRVQIAIVFVAQRSDLLGISLWICSSSTGLTARFRDVMPCVRFRVQFLRFYNDRVTACSVILGRSLMLYNTIMLLTVAPVNLAS